MAGACTLWHTTTEQSAGRVATMMLRFEWNSGCVPFLLCLMKAAMKSWGFPRTRQGGDTNIYHHRGMAKREACIHAGVLFYSTTPQVNGRLHCNDGNYGKKLQRQKEKRQKEVFYSMTRVHVCDDR